jgi:Family of unknown function (DUF6790)
VIFLVYPLAALLGATIHNFRHKDAPRAKKLETYLIWWIVVAITISWWADGYGHIHQAIEYDNHDPDNTGVVLYTDWIFPAVAWLLYFLYVRAGARGPQREPRTGTT